MPTYRIDNTTSGLHLGDFAADSPKAALDAMARDAGCDDHAHACELTEDDGSDLCVTEIESPVTFTIDSTEGSHEFCDTHNGATLDHSGWLAFVQAARRDGGSGRKVRLVLAEGDSSFTLDVEISERFTTLSKEIAGRATWTAGVLDGAVEETMATQRLARMAEGYAWAMEVLADA